MNLALAWVSCLFLGPTPTVDLSTQNQADAGTLNFDARRGAAGLLELLRRQSLTPAEVVEVRALATALGSDDFRRRDEAARKIAAFRPGAETILREYLGDANLERRRRVERLVHSWPGRWSPTEAEAAARLLKAHRPAGAVAALLDYLPFAADPGVEAEILSAIASLAAPKDPALQAAARSAVPFQRRAAEWALASPRRECSPTVRAQVLAQEFFVALSSRELEPLRKRCGLPFSLGAGFTLQSRAEFEELFGQVVRTYPRPEVTIPQVLRGEDYLRGVDQDEKAQLSRLPLHEVRAVVVRVRHGGREETGFVIIQLKPDEGWVVGLGTGK